MPEPKHILIATDFSKGAEAALAAGCREARHGGAKVTILHAYAAALDLVDQPGLSPERIEVGKAVHQALSGVRQVCEDLAEVHTEVLPCESPVQAICEYARTHAADLIVLGAHGKSDVNSLLLGSTAERVLRHASCSVLVVR